MEWIGYSSGKQVSETTMINQGEVGHFLAVYGLDNEIVTAEGSGRIKEWKRLTTSRIQVE